jgi:hypothetical protein
MVLFRFQWFIFSKRCFLEKQTKMAEGEGFEPPWACTLTVFKTAPL